MTTDEAPAVEEAPINQEAIHEKTNFGKRTVKELIQEKCATVENLEETFAHLAAQDLDGLNVSELTPITPSVISRQATINLGVVGHVSHGKSSVVRALSGTKTQKQKDEKVRGITIKLGYANVKLYKCEDPTVTEIGKQFIARFDPENDPDVIEADVEFDEDGDGILTSRTLSYRLYRHISFVDCPGHDSYMAQMLNGTAVMDAALLLIAANDECPMPQTTEHLEALNIMGLEHVIVLQNKVELLSEENGDAHIQLKKIMSAVKDSCAKKSPVIPISAVSKINIDVLAEYLCTQIPVPPRDFTSAPSLTVIRSFDVNYAGTDVMDIRGGCAGASLVKGVLRVGDEIEIRPGVIEMQDGKLIRVRPLRTTVVSLMSSEKLIPLKFAIPGGSISVGTNIDPAYTRSDKLVGHTIGYPGTLPPIYTQIEVKYVMLKKKKEGSEKDADKMPKFGKHEVIVVNVRASAAPGRIEKFKTLDNGTFIMKVELSKPVCCKVGDKITLSKKVGTSYRLSAYGTITKGVEYQLPE